MLKNEHLVAKKYFLNMLISEARIHHGKRKPEFRSNAVCVLGHHGDMYSVNVLGYLGHTIELNSILVLCSILPPQVHGVSVKWLLVCHMLPL